MSPLQLPVPLAVLFLLSKERLLTCPQRRPLLLSADELAMETQPPEKEDASPSSTSSSLPPKFQPHPGGALMVFPTLPACFSSSQCVNWL